MTKLKNILKSSSGSAMTTALIGAVAVGLGAMYLLKSGDERNKFITDLNQNTTIETIGRDIKAYLAFEKNCQEALEDDFNNIGEYSPGKEVAVGIVLETIQDNNPGEDEREIVLTFKKEKGPATARQASRRPVKINIQVFDIPLPGGGTRTTCSSFETSGVNSAIRRFCESIGGTYDSDTRICNPNYVNYKTFEEDIRKASCEVLGGSLNSGKCDKIELSGSLSSSNFSPTSITLGGASRTDSPTMECGPLEVGVQIQSNGSLVCETISCPKPTGAGASNYFPKSIGGELYCQCQKDRGSLPACGSRDPNSCTNYQANNGCGTGEQCTILRKAVVCPPSSSVPCGSGPIRDNCGQYNCGSAPACPPPPPPPPPEAPEPPQGAECEPSWRPSVSTVCDGRDFTQSDGCGNTRIRTGRKTDGACEEGANCTPSWSPSPSTVCQGETFSQTDGCGNTQTSTGTMQASGWSPDPSTVCAPQSFTQTSSNCPSRTRSATGTKADGNCGCTYTSPWGWSGSNGDHCAEYFSSSGPGTTRTMNEGERRAIGAGSCRDPNGFGPCSGNNIVIECRNSSVVIISQRCVVNGGFNEN